jgi:[ribosomal protein S18]-alanine N-acetyltransferase
MFLEVVGDNQPARALYKRLGFTTVAARKGYYQGRDALVLKSALPLSPRANIA